MNKLAIFASTFGALAFPAVALAASNEGIVGLIGRLMGIINLLIPFIIALTVLVFLIGVFLYVWGSNPSQGYGVMLTGLIGLFVMVSVWGILRLITSSLGIDQGGTLNPDQIPKVPVPTATTPR